ncbi:MAG TPA: toxin-antitoxin system [Thermoanaerobaculia bacterium]|jgi:plasmid stability protein|nr:toxin-antitoxin system [Thermoanaerobaculia bacterium]
MPQLVIDGIEDEVLKKLQQRAERNGRTLQEEVREILRNAVRSERSTPVGLGTQLMAIFSGVGVDEEIEELRGYPVEPIELDP